MKKYFLTLQFVFVIYSCSSILTDNRSEYVKIEHKSLIQTTELGSIETLSVVLLKQPRSDVVISFSSSDVKEGQLLSRALLFTTQNWFINQQVQIQGVDDAILDAEICSPYNIIVHPIISDDSRFSGLDLDDILFCNLDNERDVLINYRDIRLLYLIEALNEDTYTIELTTTPEQELKIEVQIEDFVSRNSKIEFRLSDSSVWESNTITLIFPARTETLSQTIHIRATDDMHISNSGIFNLNHEIITLDERFENLVLPVLRVSFVDIDSPGIIPSVLELDVKEGRMNLYEYKIYFTHPINNNFVLDITSNLLNTLFFRAEVNNIFLSDQYESTLSITFDTSYDYKEPVTVFFYANNGVAEFSTLLGVVNHRISNSRDSNYQTTLTEKFVSVVIQNDDISAYLLIPNRLSIEEGDSALMRLGITTEPLFPVYISFNLPQGVYMQPSNTFLFTPNNWNILQEITLSTVDLEDTQIMQDVRNLDISSTVRTLDASYFEATPKPSISLNILEDDIPTLISSVKFLKLRENDAFIYNIDVSLNANPTIPVIVNIQYDSSLLSVTPSTFRFVPDVVNEITLSVHSLDNVHLGDLNSNISFVIDVNSDPIFVGNNLLLPISIKDNDRPGVLFLHTGIELQTNLLVEESNEIVYQVVLMNEPLSGETVNVILSPREDVTEITQVSLSKTNISFSTENWNIPVDVHVTAIADDIAEGRRTVFIDHTSINPNYLVNKEIVIEVLDSMDAPSASLIFLSSGVVQNEEQKISLQESSSFEYELKLASQPFPGKVTVFLLTDEQLSVVPRLFQFDEQNWNIGQSVRVEAIDDVIVEGDNMQSFLLHTITSTEETYSSLLPQILEFNISDNGEVPSLLFSTSLMGSYTSNISEIRLDVMEGSSQRYFVRLSSEPTDTVRINLFSENRVGGAYLKNCSEVLLLFTSLGSSLLFEPNQDMNLWNIPQFVTISAILDENSLSELCKIKHDFLSNDINYGNFSSLNVLTFIQDLSNLEYSFVPSIIIMQENSDVFYVESSYTIALSSLSLIPIQIELFLSGSSVIPLEVYNGSSWVSITSRPSIEIPSLALRHTFSIRMPSDYSVINYSTFIFHHITEGDGNFDDMISVYLSWVDDSMAGIRISDLSSTFTLQEGENLILNLSILSEPLGDLNFSISLESSEQSEISLLVNNVDVCNLRLEICSWFVESADWKELSNLNFFVHSDGFIEEQENIQIRINILSDDALYNIPSSYIFDINILSDDNTNIIFSQNSSRIMEGAGVDEMITYRMLARPLEEVVLSWDTTFSESLEFLDIKDGIHKRTFQFTVLGENWNLNNVLKFRAIDDNVSLEFTEMLRIFFTASSLDDKFNNLTCFSNCLFVEVIDDDIARTNDVEIIANSTVFRIDRFDNNTSSFSEAYYLNLPLNISLEQINLEEINFNLFLNVASSSVLSNVSAISIAEHHVCVNSSDSIYCLGLGENGEFGNALMTNTNFTPVIIEKSLTVLSGVKILRSGFAFTCVVQGLSSQVYCWGKNDYGQLGSGAYSNLNVATLVSNSSMMPLISVSTLDLGYYHACASDNSNHAYCWGKGTEGELGTTQLQNSSSAVQVMSNSTSLLKNVSEVVAGGYHSCAIVGTERNVYCWGRASSGQLGGGRTTPREQYPIAVKDSSGMNMLSNVVKLSLGEEHSCAIVGTKRNVYCWGKGANGRLGIDSIEDNLLPTKVMTPEGVMFIDIAAGSKHTCGISSLNIPYCWGDGYIFLEKKNLVLEDHEIRVPQKLEGF